MLTAEQLRNQPSPKKERNKSVPENFKPFQSIKSSLPTAVPEANSILQASQISFVRKISRSILNLSLYFVGPSKRSMITIEPPEQTVAVAVSPSVVITTIPRCESCKKTEKSNSSNRTYGQCPNPKCKVMWCFVDDCNFETSNKDNELLLHIKREHRHAKSDPNTCAGCLIEAKSQRGLPYVYSDRCTTCKDGGYSHYWCLIQNCDFEADSYATVLAHQNRVHDTEFMRRDPFKCSNCNEPKTRGAVSRKGRCKSCFRFWCLVGHCDFEIALSRGLDTHILTHKNDKFFTIDSKRCDCGSAKGLKIRIEGTPKGQCPSCSAFWCLKRNCTLEFETEEQLLAHHKRGHRVRVRKNSTDTMMTTGSTNYTVLSTPSKRTNN